MSDFGFEEAIPSWDEWLGEFKKTMMPTFEKYGISMDAAVTAFTVNQLKNVLTRGGEDDEAWKG